MIEVNKSSKYITTENVQSSNVIDYWNDYICNTYIKLEAKNINNENFFGKIDLSSIDSLQISKVSSTKQKVYRTKEFINQSSHDFYIFNLQISGAATIKQDGREVVLKPNDWTFTDSTRPYELEFLGKFEQLVIKIRRDAFKYDLPQLNNVTAKLLNGNKGNGKVVAKYIKSFYRDSEKIKGSALEKTFAATVVSLIRDCLSSELFRENISPSSQLMLIKMKTFIYENLESPELSIKQIAKSFNCSPRYLHLIFEREDTTLNNFINEQRLQKCKQYLNNSFYHSLPISQICYMFGFNSLSHFSKLFKIKYGMSPRSFRVNNKSNNKIS